MMERTRRSGFTIRTQISGSTVVTAPQMPYDSAANQTVYAFSFGRETNRKIYQGSTSGTLLRTVATTWDGGNIFPITSVTALENNQQSSVATTYDGYGNVTKVQEYDWGSGTPGPLVRTTVKNYVTDSSYINSNLLNLVLQEIVYAGDVTGTVTSHTDYAYDQNTITICPTGVPQHDYYGYSCSSNIRGNLTEITRYPDPVGLLNPIHRFFTYDIFGNLRTADVNCCQKKQIT